MCYALGPSNKSDALLMTEKNFIAFSTSNVKGIANSAKAFSLKLSLKDYVHFHSVARDQNLLSCVYRQFHFRYF